MINRKLLLLFLCVYMSSCEKETETKIEYVEQHTSWQKADDFDRMSKYITNIHASETQLSLTTPSLQVFKTSTDISSLGQASGSFRKKTAISDHYFIRFNEQKDWIGIASYNKSNPKYIYPLNPSGKDSIPDFVGFGGAYIDSDWNAIRTDEKQYLFNYHTDQFEQNYCLVNFKDEGSSQIQHDSLVFVSLDKKSIYNHINIHSFYNKYFILNGPGLEIIYGDGSTRTANGIPDNVLMKSIVKLENTLYGLAKNSIFTSTDEGENWSSLILDIPESTIELFHYDYHIIEDKILMTKNDAILHMNIETEKITFSSLENDGLKNNWISGMTLFQDTVYLSTTSGAFIKPMAELLKYKEE